MNSKALDLILDAAPGRDMSDDPREPFGTSPPRACRAVLISGEEWSILYIARAMGLATAKRRLLRLEGDKRTDDEILWGDQHGGL